MKRLGRYCSVGRVSRSTTRVVPSSIDNVQPQLGSQSIDGVPTPHYSATLQMSRILDRLPGGQQAAAKAALEKLGSAGSILPCRFR